MDPIERYINKRELPNEKHKDHKVQVQSAKFSLIDKELFKISLNGSYLKCLAIEQGHYVLAELHGEIFGNHPDDRSLAHKAHTQGYYWPTMKSNAADYVCKCDRCQRQAPTLRSLAQDLMSISSSWPFAQLGIDIVRPLPIAPTQKIATDYFNKWIEAEAFASIKHKEVLVLFGKISFAGSAFPEKSY